MKPRTCLLASLTLLVWMPLVWAQQPVVNTVCGGGPNHVLATSIYVGTTGVAVNGNGEVHLAGGRRVFKVDMNGILTVVAGTGGDGEGTGVHATRAALFLPRDLAFDAAGNLYIADLTLLRRVDAITGIITNVHGPGTSGEIHGIAIDSASNIYFSDFSFHRVKRRDAMTGTITTVAGTGVAGYSGDGDPADLAALNRPRGLALDPPDGLLIADAENRRVRRVNLTTGIIQTVAGNGSIGFAGEGGPATSASLIYPSGIDVDTTGNILFTDYDYFDADGPWDSRVWRVDAITGIITRVAGNDVSYNPDDGGPATSANLYYPEGIAVVTDGTFYVADEGKGLGGFPGAGVRRIDGTTGIITTHAGGGSDIGDGEPATDGNLRFPTSVGYDSAGNLYVADRDHFRIRRVDAVTRVMTTVAGNGGLGFSGDGAPAAEATLWNASGLAIDSSGDIYIADTRNHRIRRVSAATGVISTAFGNGSTTVLNQPLGVAVDPNDNVLIADTNHHRILRAGTVIAGTGVGGFAGDGGPATGASLLNPTGVASDSNGNIFVADRDNMRVRRIDATTGFITTVAGNGTQGDAGVGGPATQAALNFPSGVAIEANGDLLIADEGNNKVKRVSLATGLIETIAGSGIVGFTGDGGPATAARTNVNHRPAGVAVSPSGDIAFTDNRNHRIRVVSAVPPAPGAVPDADLINGVHLSVRHAPGGDITLTWGLSCVPSDIDYAVYEGELGSFTSHTPVTCSTTGGTGMTFTPSPGDRYYLVVPLNGVEEGSYGISSDGSQRPPGLSPCLPQRAGSCTHCGDGATICLP